MTRTVQLAAVGQLAAGIAREINNPINGVINYAQILPNRQAVADENSEVLHRIMKEGGRIAGIVENLLFFARDSGDERVLNSSSWSSLLTSISIFPRPNLPRPLNNNGHE